MPIAAAGASILGGVLGGSAASNAAQTQNRAAQAAAGWPCRSVRWSVGDEYDLFEFAMKHVPCR
jgi:hypothetical protein